MLGSRFDWLTELGKVAQFYLLQKGFLVCSFVIWDDFKGYLIQLKVSNTASFALNKETPVTNNELFVSCSPVYFSNELSPSHNLIKRMKQAYLIYSTLHLFWQNE